MSFISLPTGKLRRKTKIKKVKDFLTGYAEDFKRILLKILAAQLVLNFMVA